MNETHDETGEQGLHGKYLVYKNGKPQDGCFVLKPETDPAARAALEAYVDKTGNERLATDLREWLARIDDDQ